MAPSRVCCLGVAVRLPLLNSLSEPLSLSEICSTESVPTRVAASSMASGMPSSCLHTSATAPALRGVKAKAGLRYRARPQTVEPTRTFPAPPPSAALADRAGRGRLLANSSRQRCPRAPDSSLGSVTVGKSPKGCPPVALQRPQRARSCPVSPAPSFSAGPALPYRRGTGQDLRSPRAQMPRPAVEAPAPRAPLALPATPRPGRRL